MFSGSGELRKAIERNEESQAEEIYTCLYGEDYLPHIEGFMNDRNHDQLASFEEAAKINANFSAEEGIMAECLFHTRRLVHILFERMAKVAEHLDSVQAKPPGAGHWSGYARRSEDPRGAEVIEGASSDKDLVAGLCLFKGIANLLDALFVRNTSITCAKLQKQEETFYREFGETLKGNLE